MYKFRKSLYVNICIAIGWFSLFYPGFYSTDSFSAIRNSSSTNLVPGANEWNQFVRVFSLGGQYPEVVVLLQAVILNLSVTIITFYLIRNPRHASLVSMLLCLTPTVGAMGITLWRDIPFTSGLLLLGPYVLWVMKDEKSLRFVHFFMGSLIGVLISFKQNGLIVILLVITSLVFLRKYKLSWILAIPFVVTLTLALSTFVYPPESKALAKSYAVEWMFSDLSCLASRVDDLSFAALINSKTEMRREWDSEEACTFINRSNVSSARENVVSRVPTYWIDAFEQAPRKILDIHFERHSYLLPPFLAKPPNLPFLHTTVEIKDTQVRNLFPNFVEAIRVFPRAWNYFRGFFAWSGLWLFVMLFFLLTRPKDNDNLRISVLIGFALSITLFVSAPIPDARYALFNLIVGQIVLLAHLSGKLRKPLEGD